MKRFFPSTAPIKFCINVTYQSVCLYVCLLVWFGFLLNVPVNDFSVMLGRSHRFLGTLGSLKCLAQGHYTAVVGFEPWTSRSGVRRSTTEPARFPVCLSVSNAYSN